MQIDMLRRLEGRHRREAVLGAAYEDGTRSNNWAAGGTALAFS